MKLHFESVNLKELIDTAHKSYHHCSQPIQKFHFQSISIRKNCHKNFLVIHCVFVKCWSISFQMPSNSLNKVQSPSKSCCAIHWEICRGLQHLIHDRKSCAFPAQYFPGIVCSPSVLRVTMRSTIPRNTNRNLIWCFQCMIPELVLMGSISLKYLTRLNK